MATKKKASTAKKPKKSAKWAKNASDYAKKQAAKAKAKSILMNQEDAFIKKGKAKRIRDVGQKPPKGYMRTGGLWFAKIENARPIRSLTTMQQRGLFYANKPKFLGTNGSGGYLGSAANQGMYNGETGEANFRKTAGARKLIDADGGTYAPGYKKPDGKIIHAGKKQAAKSRYIMAIGQDGHKR